MVNQQTLQGNWNEIKGKLRSKWGQLTNDDLQSVHGNVDQLIGLIQRKHNKAEAFRDFLADMVMGAGTGVALLYPDEMDAVADHAAAFHLDFDDA